MHKKLLEHFSETIEGPIEVDDVANAVIALGVQDSVIFSPEDIDPGKVRGVFYQYTTHPGVYAAPELVSLIVYSSNISLEWQRLVCCKELIHVCDAAVEKTNTQEEVSELLEKLLGPLSTEDYGLADLMAAVDRLALYQALAILFPLSMREKALLQITEGKKSHEKVAEWVCLPAPLVALVLSSEWPEIQQQIFDI